MTRIRKMRTQLLYDLSESDIRNELRGLVHAVGFRVETADYGRISSSVEHANANPTQTLATTIHPNDVHHLTAVNRLDDALLSNPDYWAALAIFHEVMRNTFSKNFEEIISYLELETDLGIFAILEVPYLRLTQDAVDSFKALNKLDSVVRRAADSIGGIASSYDLVSHNDIALCTKNILPENPNAKHLIQIMEAFTLEFLTGEMKWGVHNGFEYIQDTLFSPVVRRQIM